VATTSEESGEHETDPTADLPPVLVADAWLTTPPPPRGSGWWGHGAPIRVQQNYKVRDLVDGAGLCSPGRWHPHNRRLPDNEGLAEGLLKAMGYCPVVWEALIYKLLTGTLQQCPFTEVQVKKEQQHMS
jgi:hypothetical protein